MRVWPRYDAARLTSGGLPVDDLTARAREKARACKHVQFTNQSDMLAACPDCIAAFAEEVCNEMISELQAENDALDLRLRGEIEERERLEAECDALRDAKRLNKHETQLRQGNDALGGLPGAWAAAVQFEQYEQPQCELCGPKEAQVRALREALDKHKAQYDCVRKGDF